MIVYYCCVKCIIKGFVLCHGRNVFAAVASTVLFFPLHIDNSDSLRHKNGQTILIIL